MLSGQLTPSSANSVPRQQQYINEGDPTSSNLQNKFEKIYSNPALVQIPSTKSSPIQIQNNSRITTNATTISVSEILNITDVKSVEGQLSLCSTNLPITTTSPASDANGRSAALERAYVHDVYENCEEASGPIRPRVSQFLAGLEPGSIVCDVGCGNGRYLTSCNPLICSIGVDRCFRLAKLARERGGEVAMCDNLELPFRDESFDAVLSLAVVHHFATTERRVGAIRELARILRIGGRVVITVWAFEQRHRRFESQDVLIPWQPPKNRNYTYSDDEDDDDYLPPYHAYTEDSTNSSRSAGDGDSSSLSSSSPGESCYSFVRRAIQKLAGGRKHSWFLDSWNSKDTKNDSSLDYEDAKDLPIELRRLEDFEDFPDPPLSAGLKSRSLGSILNPPPRQIVRSRSSVPSLGAQMPEQKSQQSGSGSGVGHQSPQNVYVTTTGSTTALNNIGNVMMSHTTVTSQGDSTTSSTSQTTSGGRRPKLVKQKQSLCDEEYQLTDSNLHLSHSNCSSNSSSCCNIKNINSRNIKSNDSKLFLRKQSSLNEELMAESRLREKDRVRRRIQKQMSLNEAFLCRSLFAKRLQIIREGFTTRLKTSTGSLERATKNGFVKIMQNFKGSQFSSSTHVNSTSATTPNDNTLDSTQSHTNTSNNHSKTSTNCTGDSSTNSCNNNCNNSNCNNVNNGIEDQKPRRHSRESGSDSSKDSSLQSDTSIESEDSFASVIYIPRPEQKNQQQNSNNMNSNNGNCINSSGSCKLNSSHKVPSVPTSPLVLPCPPTPAHSPAAGSISLSTIPSPAGLSMLSPQNVISISNTLQGNSRSLTNRFTFDEEHILQHKQQNTNTKCSTTMPTTSTTKVTDFRNNSSGSVFDKTNTEFRQQHKIQKITRQTIKDLPPIPKFRKHQSLQSSIYKSNFPIVRRSSASPAVPKLMSLEIFNPETDDLDSDSSEPSSPDSIDSVISALKSGADEDSVQQHQQSVGDTTKVKHHHSLDESKLYQHRENVDEQYSLENLNVNVNQQQSGNVKDRVKLDSEKQILNSSIVVEENHSDITNDKHLGISKIHDINNSNSSHLFCKSNNSNRQEFVDFAEQLSAQLLKELDEKNKLETNFDVNSINNESESPVDNPFVNKQHCEMNELYTLREELRERRLMLANLTSQYNQQKSPTPTSSSTSSLSSQTRSFTIHEEEDENNEPSVSTYDSRNFKTKYLRKITSSSGFHQYNFIPDTACLIQDDGEGSGREDDYDEMENGVIMEEDEDQLDGDGDCNVGETDRVESNVSNPCLEDTISSPTQIQLQTRPSTESWGHSNSETSLDSSSQGGGATTHHRYYHVFREGELDALINHHVASLHIVSSYYERASWCVVAEKVQLWTI